MIVKFIDEMVKVNMRIQYYHQNPTVEYEPLEDGELCQDYPYLSKKNNNIKCLLTTKLMNDLSKKFVLSQAHSPKTMI